MKYYQRHVYIIVYCDNQVHLFIEKGFQLLKEKLVISNMLHILDASNWKFKIEMMTKTIHQIL